MGAKYSLFVFSERESEEFTDDQGLVLDEGKGPAQMNGSVWEAQPQERKQKIQGLKMKPGTRYHIDTHKLKDVVI